MKLIQGLWFLFAAIGMLYAGYLAVLALPGFLKKRPRMAVIQGKNTPIKIAVLIPARNEEATISRSVESLCRQHYSKKYYQVFCIPNNCSDRTAEVARASGAEILTPQSEIHTKGDVLREIVPKIFDEMGFDAICIFDADNKVEPNFLDHIASAFAAGYPCAQGYRESLNPRESFASGACSVYYWMDHYFYTLGRWNVGGSALINGTGFGFTKECFQAMGGWKTVSLTEDIELSGICALYGQKIAWVPEACTLDEQPGNFRTTWRQRLRWTVGMYQCLKAWFVLLCRGFLKGRILTATGEDAKATRATRFMMLDMALFYAFPLAAIVGIFGWVLGILNQVLLLAKGWIGLSAFLAMPAAGIVGSFVFMTVLATLASLRAGKNLRDSWKGILSFWYFGVMWIPIAVVALFCKNLSWKAIPHGPAKN